MTLTDGNTTLTFSNNFIEEEHPIEFDEQRTAGAAFVKQVGGTRFLINERVRVNASEWKSLIDLIQNATDGQLFYSPSNENAGMMAQFEFPMRVMVDYGRPENRVYNGEVIYYLNLEIKSVEWQ